MSRWMQKVVKPEGRAVCDGKLVELRGKVHGRNRECRNADPPSSFLGDPTEHVSFNLQLRMFANQLGNFRIPMHASK
jgi:hypothetical protein